MGTERYTLARRVIVGINAAVHIRSPFLAVARVGLANGYALPDSERTEYRLRLAAKELSRHKTRLYSASLVLSQKSQNRRDSSHWKSDSANRELLVLLADLVSLSKRLEEMDVPTTRLNATRQRLLAEVVKLTTQTTNATVPAQ